MTRKHLLLSTSRTHGTGYLEHAQEGVEWLLGSQSHRIAFIPYAAVRFSYDDYEAMVAGGMPNHDVRSVHRSDDPGKVIDDADAILVGGGNTFKLVHDLHAFGLISRVREKALAGTPYMGWSAGANVASPRLCTTNDMPIIEPASFSAFGLIQAQINPHYLDAHPDKHMGETRDERLQEFVVINPDVPVVAMREGAWLQVEGDSIVLGGHNGARLYLGNDPVLELEAGADLSRFA